MAHSEKEKKLEPDSCPKAGQGSGKVSTKYVGKMMLIGHGDLRRSLGETK